MVGIKKSSSKALHPTGKQRSISPTLRSSEAAAPMPRESFFAHAKPGMLWLAGISLILIGFVIEDNLSLIKNWIAFLNTGKIKPSEYVSILPVDVLSITMLKELGVAIIIAAIIIGGIEKRTRDADHASAKKLREEVAKDAVFAIFSVQHTREFVRAAVETNLGAEIVREDAHLGNALRTLTAKEAKTISPKNPDDALQRFVISEVVSNFILKNVSASKQLVNVQFELELRQGEGPRKLTGAQYVCIDGQVLSRDEIDSSASLSQDGGELHYEWPRWVDSGDSIRVIIGVRCVKERSDNEVWESFFPTMGNMTFSLSVLPSMSFGVRALSNSEIVEEPTVPSDTEKTWRMQGPLLCHDSVVFWWRTPEDDARPEISTPNEFAAADAQGRMERELASGHFIPQHDPV